jgi:hypothetical protein
MVKYLQMDGVDDYIKVVAVSYDEIELDIISEWTTGNRYYLDGRTGQTNGYFFRFNGNDVWGSDWTVYHNGVAKTSGTKFVVTGERCTLRLIANTNYTNDINLFSRYNSVEYFNGKVYGVKIWLDGVLQAHYDMSTGTVQDQSGNGNHATLNGGTWLDDGTGGTTETPVTITSVIATTTADSIAPTISTQSSVSTSMDILTVTVVADAIYPGIRTDSNLLSLVSTATADALIPQAGSFTNISVKAVVVSATADVISPLVDVVRNINIAISIADAIASAMGAIIKTPKPVIITTIQLKAVTPGALYLKGSPSTAVHINVNTHSTIHLKGGI